MDLLTYLLYFIYCRYGGERGAPIGEGAHIRVVLFQVCVCGAKRDGVWRGGSSDKILWVLFSLEMA